MSLRKSSNISSSTPNELAKKTESAPRTPFAILSALLGIVVVAVVIGMLAIRPRMVAVRLGTTTIAATLADTPAARTQGLSGRATLPANQGMLFVFPADDTWRFWMKDMRYSLDIIWLDADKKVVTIVPHATPGSYPHTIFSPTTRARYVLEVTSGVAAKSNITVGEKATFALP